MLKDGDAIKFKKVINRINIGTVIPIQFDNESPFFIYARKRYEQDWLKFYFNQGFFKVLPCTSVANVSEKTK